VVIATSQNRAEDAYEINVNGAVNRTESYIFFSLIARLPLLLALISIFFIAILLVDAACELSLTVVLVFVGATSFILALRYIFWVLVWVVFGISMGLMWIVVGLSKAGSLLIVVFKFVATKTRDLLS
jgi:hypothetical protein